MIVPETSPLFEEVKKKSSDVGLSISAYLRFLVKQDLAK